MAQAIRMARRKIQNYLFTVSEVTVDSALHKMPSQYWGASPLQMTFQILAMGTATTKEDPRFSQEDLINLHYVDAPPLGGSGQALIKQTYGLRDWLTDTSFTLGREIAGPSYGLKVLEGSLYFTTVLNTGDKALITVSGENSANYQDLTIPGSLSSRVFIETDGNYVYTLLNGVLEQFLSLTTNPTPAIPPLTAPGSLAFLDNYLIAGDTATKLVAWSNAGDGTTWDALDFASAESNTSDVVRVFVDHSELWIFKRDRTEIWGTSGGSQRFVRISGGIERGLLGRMAVTKSENLVYFIGDDRVIYAASLQGSPQRVSNTGVERILQDVDSFDDVVAYSWSEGGDRYSAWRFPDRPAVVLGHTTGLWHRRSSGLNGEPYCVTSTASFAGKQLAACTDGHIREFAPDAFKDGDTVVARDLYSGPLNFGKDRFCLDYFAADMRMGDVSLGYDPSVMLRLSNGKVWDAPRAKTFGDLGDHQRVVEWGPLGQGRHRAAHLRVTDPVPVSIYGGVYQIS